MTLLDTMPSTADRRAAEHFRANLDALKVSQPTQSKLFDSPPDIPWLFARDGSLTARDKLGQWWAGCSLPSRAGKALLKKLDVRGVAACMLAPTHAGQVVATLEKLQPQQALIVIQPDATEARVMHCCGDFAADIRSHRLWLATGEDWAAELRKIFDDHPGLPTPSQFIRLPVTPEEISTPLIRLAEQIFNEVTAARNAQLAQLPHKETSRLLLIAPSHFRLWDDAGHAMIQCLASEETVIHLDPDDPAQSSSLGLALAAAECGSLLVADRARADLPSVLRPEMPVITWITQPRIPNYDAQFPRDALLLADEQWVELAKRTGWPAHRLSIAHWPPALREPSGSAAGHPPSPSALSLITDTHSLETPLTELELSSHHVLWESLRADILSDPFSVQDPGAFIDRRRRKLGIAEEGFNLDFFLNRLIIPAYQQAIVARLLSAKLPVRLHGKGWTAFPNADHGPITNRAEFLTAIANSALIYPLPVRHRHAIDSLGQPVLGPQRNEADLVREAKRILAGSEQPLSSQPLSFQTIHGSLQR